MYRMWFLHSSILNTCMSSTSWLCGNELGRANTYLFPTCSHSFELYLEVKLLNHMVVLFLMVILFSIVVFPFNNPIYTAQGSPFTTSLPALVIFSLFILAFFFFFFYSSLLNGPRTWVDSTMLPFIPWSHTATMPAGEVQTCGVMPRCKPVPPSGSTHWPNVICSMIIMRAGNIVLDRSLWGKMS